MHKQYHFKPTYVPQKKGRFDNSITVFNVLLGLPGPCRGRYFAGALNCFSKDHPAGIQSGMQVRLAFY